MAALDARLFVYPVVSPSSRHLPLTQTTELLELLHGYYQQFTQVLFADGGKQSITFKFQYKQK
jgi:hypothetical protein